MKIIEYDSHEKEDVDEVTKLFGNTFLKYFFKTNPRKKRIKS
jgi:hypothetical protein